jgi:hypothetical protein
VGRRDDIVRTLLAFAVVAALGLAGAVIGRGTVLGQQGGNSGSSSSGGNTSSGSSNSSESSDGSSNSNSEDGTSNSNREDGSSNSNGEDGSSNSNGSSPGSDDDGTPDTTSPAGVDPPGGPTTTLAPTASTIPPDLPADVPPTEEVDCPDDVASSSAGGRVRCFQVDPDEVEGGDDVLEVGIPGIAVPVPLPVAVPVPVAGDTGDSGSTTNDNSVTVVYDIDNQVAIDGFADETGRVGQRVLATLALLLLIPVWIMLLVGLRRFLARPEGPQPPAPPPPAGRWVWEAAPPPPPDEEPGR